MRKYNAADYIMENELGMLEHNRVNDGKCDMQGCLWIGAMYIEALRDFLPDQ